MLQKKFQEVVIPLILILPFSHFIFNQLDIWHAQGFLFQSGLVILFSAYLFQKNKPLAFLFCWIGLFTAYITFIVMTKQGKYNSPMFFPFFNFLCMVIFYDLIRKSPKEIYLKIIKSLCYVVGIILVYAILQKFSLDQFYRSADSTLKTCPDYIQGTIGNQMHFAHYLCICLPVFFILPKVWCKIFILFTLIVLSFLSSTSGIFIAVIVILYCSYFFKMFTKKEIILGFILMVVLLLLKSHNVKEFISLLTTSSGRTQKWIQYYPIFKQKAITGQGLGFINIMSTQEAFKGWRHMHFELYHFAVELGLIGVGFIIWGIVDYSRRFITSIKSDVSIITSGMFLGGVLTSFFGYPTHLWLLSSLIMFAYSYQYREVSVENT